MDETVYGGVGEGESSDGLERCQAKIQQEDEVRESVGSESASQIIRDN